MSATKKILILGDYQDYPYHPFGGVDTAMKDIIGTSFDITCTEDYIALERLNEYDLFISYTDCWKRADAVSDAQAAGLISYVANGGKFLMVHCGISLQVRGELIPLMGGKFDHHPKMTEILVTPIDAIGETGEIEPITNGVAPFTTTEEPYQFTFDPFSPVTLLSHYTLNGKTYPHSWKKRYCKGEVVYLMGGHTKTQIAEAGNAHLLKNAVEYLLR